MMSTRIKVGLLLHGRLRTQPDHNEYPCARCEPYEDSRVHAESSQRGTLIS